LLFLIVLVSLDDLHEHRSRGLRPPLGWLHHRRQ